MQLDPGDWTVSATVFDSETNEALAHHQPIDVHIPGQVHHAHAFDNSTKYDINVQIQSVQKLGATLYRVHYLLGNHGTTTVPPGMLVRAMIVENDDTLAWQDYHFELACPPGEPDPKYLTLEGSSAITNAVVYVIADPSGPSEVVDTAHLTVDGSGVHLTR